MADNPTKIDNDIQTEVPGEQKLRELKDNSDNEESTVNDENKIDSSTEDTFTPVIKVTKHEAVFTKGDLKLQKVTVTEDISIRNSSHEDLLVQEVPSLQPLRIPRNEELEENGTNGVEEDKAMTRAQKAPKQRLRQALESLKKRRDSAENNSTVSTRRRSSIPKLIRKTKNIEESTPKEETKPEIPIEAEFDKIYDEIVDNEPIDVIDESKLEEIIADVKDPEEKFEEVVHAYEENKLQPISIEKPKSRIPLKKQISQNEAKVENPKPSLRKSYSVDSRNNDKQSAAKKSKDVAVKQNAKSKDEYVNIHEKEDIVTYRVVQTDDDDLKRNGDIIHPSLSNDPNNNDNKIIKQDNDVLHSSERNVNTPDEVDRNNPIIGKVGRLISKIDSNEFAYNDKKRKDDVSGSFKKVSILSKIAMFEEVSAKSEITPRTPPPTPITIDKPKLSNQTSFERRRPIIVEEVYKEETAANNDFEENPANDNLVLHNKKDTETDKEPVEIREANNYDVQANSNEEYNNNDNDNDINVVIEEVSKETEPEDVDSRLHRLISRQDERLRKAVSITDLAVNHEDVKDVNEGNSIERPKDEKEYLHEASSIEGHIREREENESLRPRPRRMSVSDRIALFENKLTPVSIGYSKNTPTRKLIDYKPRITPQLSRSNLHKSSSSLTKSISSLTIVESKTTMTEEQYAEKIEDLKAAKMKYGVFKEMKYVELNNGEVMPVIALGTALLDPKLTYHIVTAAIDLGYRSFDTAYIYGNEKAVGDAIRAKIEDGTIKREEVFIINKLWSTFHQTDLVEVACRNSLDAMGLDYFDLYLIHNPMSFKEGSAPLPKIANVIQFSAHDFLDAWFGMEGLVSKGLVKSIGVSNFNSAQVARVVEKGRIRPVVNQVESHPYLNQLRLADACLVHDVVLSCYGCLGSVGSEEYRSPAPPVIEDSVVKVAAAGLGVTPAQLLLRYQLELGRTVVTKASSADRLWNNLLALTVDVDPSELAALNALNRNKRMFTFKGMGDTHRNYPFNIPF